MNTSIAASFVDRSAARSAVEMLVADGVPREQVALHENVSAARNAASLKTDEVLTGGFLGSFTSLLDHLFETPPSAGNAETYADLVRSEGAVLAIDLGDDGSADAGRCQQLLRDAGAVRVSTLPLPGASG